jgi:RNA polymerase sigma factor (sigma-70 family)
VTASALWTKHRNIAYAIAADYFIPGQDRDDVNQEALIGLWIAARKYDKAKGAFPPFARLVVHRHLWNAIKAQGKRKHRFLTDAEREFDAPALETENGQFTLIVNALPSLSELERSALARSLNGEPIESKAHDNALQRARRKLKAAA